ncbi:MAG: 3-deoxy-D-manno-octulosonic acid transferase [Flavobacteriales bacterium]|nr:3-deoxy-D-manno-octulosonic acid transferase [Flavobacteriales bacterium]
MALLVGLGTALYHTGIRLAAPFVPKARAWVDGRKDLWQRLEKRSDELRGCLWMHCASVGEFEQGRPVLEAIKRERPELPVLLTFFSPSGYDARKDYPLATHVEYLPPDSAANARRLQQLIRPRAAIFIKYEFWYQHLHALKEAAVPIYLVSAIFRSSQPFFTWYGAAYRGMLRCFDRLFVQDEASHELLSRIDVRNVSVSGDTRFDRVSQIVATAKSDTAAADHLHLVMDRFRRAGARPVLVCGSTWPADIRIIAGACSTLSTPIRRVIVPHELHREELDRIGPLFLPEPLHRWSNIGLDRYTPGPVGTLLVDRMGYLSRLYAYADITYVGGGFGSGIHNTLEAAAWGKPVIFGPNHARFAEAQGLIDAGAGFSISTADELRDVLQRLLGDDHALERASQAARDYVTERTGATQRVSAVILERLER